MVKKVVREFHKEKVVEVYKYLNKNSQAVKERSDQNICNPNI